jgi:hypothetical protein
MISDTIGRQGDGELPSGRFVLRIEPDLHLSLRETAKAEGLSLNELCVRRLALPESRLPPEAGRAVAKAADVLGPALLGVVAFGSWARKELAARSDLDLLLVPDGGIGIDRSLYRRWDEAPLAWEGHAVEPHFAHLPAPEDRITGFWAEVALDGIVLFDRDLAVSRSLARLRRRIASGEITRRLIHGQTYWVEVA